MSGKVWTRDIDEIRVITVHNPPVNALGHEVRKGLIHEISKAENDESVAAIILTGDEGKFVGGADIKEFAAEALKPDIPELVDFIEDCAKLVVSAIQGYCLGGGLELALATHYRCADKSSVLGLPEVKLGLLPGAGGTQRLPRIAGIPFALEMIVQGERITANQALDNGVVDVVFEGNILEQSLVYTKDLIKTGAGRRKTGDLSVPETDNVDSKSIFDEYRRKIATQARGLLSPWKAIDAIEASLTMPISEGCEYESKLFMECLSSPQSKAQIHAFFAEREVGKKYLSKKMGNVVSVNSAGVLGSGTMGAGIAMSFANAGIPVKILDKNKDSLKKAIENIKANYDRSAQKGRISLQEAQNRHSLIEPVYEDIDSFKDLDIVVEAVYEEMSVKKAVFKELDSICKKSAILATNTSSLDINEIASCTSRPESVIGMHFFSPANIMRLVEVVEGEMTKEDIVCSVMQLCKRMNKIGVVVGVCDGFVANRMAEPYYREASLMLEEGALPKDIDEAIYEFGMPMGPFTLGDLAGNDIDWRMRKRRKEEGAYVDNIYPYTVADTICEMGRFGQKVGKGWYKYEPGNRTPVLDEEVHDIICKRSLELGVEQRVINSSEIVERCIFSLINEGALILEEGIARSPTDIDVIFLNGFGFPVHTGGPMFYADHLGIKNVYRKLKKFEEIHGKHWRPSNLIKQLAEEDKGFYEAYANQ